ncbi:hypothetical protein GJ744_010206 [Endocarpon pusillum]|uniref:Uncharacterized protein n=1 Tax=Endocarpon pusillum TaxID=364733 RepID=A0A8H7AEW0_9EURO|nr:hypothetical protein GJ744_010206 [Endocarpon pusillum]
MTFEEAQRFLAEHRAKAEQLEAEEARANGFSTYEEYWESRVEASRMEQLERDKELETRAIQMGMTLEQLELTLEMEDPQRWVPRGWNLMARPPPCDCKDHLNETFCPKALGSYTTQDGVELAEMLARQRAIQIDDLHIEQGDISRRLSQDMLEKAWARSSQNHRFHIPFWAHADPVVKQSVTLTSDSRSFSVSPSPSPSPRLQSTIDQTSDTATPSTNASVPSRSLDEQRQLLSYMPEDTSLSHQEAIQAQPAQPSEIGSKAISRCKIKSETKGRPPRRRGAAPTSERRGVFSGRVEKLSGRPSSSTRSQKFSCLYELGPSGVADRQHSSGSVSRKFEGRAKS